MIIKTLRIGHFGKLSNKQIDFTEGFNIIRGSNESGKSTIHAFIRAMLFGNDKQRGRTPAAGSAYDRYLPWDAPGSYQGSMDFEHDGREYRITRVFFQKEKSCVLTELATGKVIELADDSITSLIPELTASAFDNTVSAGQKLLKSSDSFSGEVRNFIANLATTRDNEVNIEKALTVLNKRKKELEKSIGECDTTALEQRQKELLEKEEEAEKLEAEAHAHEKRAREYAGQLEELTASPQYKSKDDCDGIPEIAFMLRSFSEVREAVALQQAEIEKLRTGIGELEDKKRRTEEKIDILSGKDRPKDEEDRGTERAIIQDPAAEKTGEQGPAAEKNHAYSTVVEYEEASRRSGRNGNICGIATVILLLLSVVISNVFRLMIPTLVVLIAVIVCAASFTVNFIKSRELKKECTKLMELSREKELLRLERINDLQQELAAAEAVCSERRLQLENAEQSLNRKEQQLDGLTEQIGRKVDNDAGLLRIFGDSEQDIFETDPDRLLEMYERAKETKRRIAAREAELNGLIDGEDDEEDKINRSLRDLGDIGSELTETENSIRLMSEKAEAQKVEKEAVELALRTLTKLSEELHDSFGSRINRLLSAEAARVTNGIYTQARVTKDFGIEVMGNLDYVRLEALSTGTQEQLYLALRFAVAELFFENVRIPLLLDESFAYYDDERLKSAISALLSRSGQIFLFTCQKREETFAGDNVNVICL